MGTVKILAVSFLAATLAGCGQQENIIFSCKGADRKAEVITKGEWVMLSLQKEELISLHPYFRGYAEIWHEALPRQQLEYQKSAASSFCRTGILPQTVAP